MAVRALADIHLSSDENKPMDIFGPEWDNHHHRLQENWDRTVDNDDLVIIPGDISWAMYLSEAGADLAWIGARPGTKLLVRGNHDYWWSAVGKVRKALPDGVFVLQNDSFVWQDVVICGSRGWNCPGDTRFNNEQDLKIYHREVQRLELSLKSARAKGTGTIIAAMHFPPFNVRHEPSGFTELFVDYGVKICVYGHLHGESKKLAFEGTMDGVKYIFVAADYLDFCPVLISPG